MYDKRGGRQNAVGAGCTENFPNSGIAVGRMRAGS